MARQRSRPPSRARFFALLESLEPRWMMSGSPGDDVPVLVGEAEAGGQSQPAAAGAILSLPAGGSMANPVFGSTFVSSLGGGTGFWDDASSWAAGRAPTATDKVIIQAGDTVIVRNTAAIAQAIGVYEGGKLAFATNVDTELKVVTIVVLGEFEMGTAANPIAAGVRARLTIRDVAINTTTDPGSWGNGLVVLGKIRVHGAVKEVSDNRLAISPRAGDTTLTFENSVTGWQAGDKLYLPGTRQLTWDENNGGVPLEGESATIASVSGNVVTLTSTLTWDHLGAESDDGSLAFKVPVQNLTRNAIIRSENMNGTRGHTLFAGRADVDIRYAQFGGLGRSRMGEDANFRLPVYFYHLIGPTTPQANGYQYSFIGNAITCPLDPMPFKWGLAIHNSHFGLIQNNDLNNWAGSGLVTLTGAETQNVIEGNRVMRINGNGWREDNFNFPLGEAGVGYWFRGPDNYVRDNIAANVRGGIYSYGFNAAHLRMVGVVTMPAFQGADPTAPGQSIQVDVNGTPFRQFQGNEAFACQNGLTFWWLGTLFQYGGYDVESQLRDFKAWNIYNWGMFLYESNRLTIDGYQYLSTAGTRSAVDFSDYMGREFLMQDSLIINGHVGLPAQTGLRNLPANDETVGRVTVKDTRIVGGSLGGVPPWSVSFQNELPKRVALLMNVDFENSPTTLSFGPGGGGNWDVENYAVIHNYDSPAGVDGEDFVVQATYRTTGIGTQQPDRPEIVGKIYPMLPDAAAPAISNISTAITTTGATIGWNTSELAAYQIKFGLTSAYGQSVTHAGFATSRNLTIAGLQANTTYHYQLVSWDVYGNLVESGDMMFTTPAFESTPPSISNVTVASVGATSAAISWLTDEPANSRVEYGTTVAYGSATVLQPLFTVGHTVTVTSLLPETTYHFRVLSRDPSGNLTASSDFTFTTTVAPDTTPPTISQVAAASITETGAAISWLTDEPATTQIEYGTTTSYGQSTTLAASLNTAHSASLTGLAPNTTYHYRVKSSDAAGNLRVSQDFTFKTYLAVKRILDDGRAGHSFTGTWRRITGRGYENDIQTANKGTGSSSSWTFASLPAGEYRVWATWKISSSYATNAPFTLYDGNVARRTVQVNQRLTPNDLSADGALWKLLGTVTVSSGKLVVKLTNSANGTVQADAIRMERVPPASVSTAAPEISVSVGGFEMTSGQSVITYGPANLGTPQTFTYTVTNQGAAALNLAGVAALPAGFTLAQNLGTTNLAPGASTSFAISLAAGSVGSFGGVVSIVNNDSNENPFTIQVAGSVVDPNAPFSRIIDDGSAGHQFAGTWTRDTTRGYGGDLFTAKAGTGTATSTWNFSAIPNGTYEVFATWRIGTANASNAPYTLYNGSQAVGTVRKDQRATPNDSWDGTTLWESLGTVTVTGGQLVVRLTNAADNQVVADAIRVSRLNSDA